MVWIRTQRELEEAENLLSVGRGLLEPATLDKPSMPRDTTLHTGQSLSDSCRGLLDLISKDRSAMDKQRQETHILPSRTLSGVLLSQETSISSIQSRTTGASLNPETSISSTLSRPTGARLKKSKSCQRDTSEQTVHKGSGARRVKKQRSEGTNESCLAEGREHYQGHGGANYGTEIRHLMRR